MSNELVKDENGKPIHMNLNHEEIVKIIHERHQSWCPSFYGPDIYVDWSQEFVITNHNWRPNPYKTLDFMVECQNCNKAGSMSLRVKDELFTKGSENGTRECR